MGTNAAIVAIAQAFYQKWLVAQHYAMRDGVTAYDAMESFINRIEGKIEDRSEVPEGEDGLPEDPNGGTGLPDGDRSDRPIDSDSNPQAGGGAQSGGGSQDDFEISFRL